MARDPSQKLLHFGGRHGHEHAHVSRVRARSCGNVNCPVAAHYIPSQRVHSVYLPRRLVSVKPQHAHTPAPAPTHAEDNAWPAVRVGGLESHVNGEVPHHGGLARAGLARDLGNARVHALPAWVGYGSLRAGARAARTAMRRTLIGFQSGPKVIEYLQYRLSWPWNCRPPHAHVESVCRSNAQSDAEPPHLPRLHLTREHEVKPRWAWLAVLALGTATTPRTESAQRAVSVGWRPAAGRAREWYRAVAPKSIMEV